MENEMRKTFKDELEIFYRMSGIFIQMIMQEAEKQNSTIKADLGYMENYKALQEMKEFEKLVMTEEFTLTKKPTKKGTLPFIGSQEVEVQELKLKVKKLEDEIESLKF